MAVTNSAAATCAGVVPVETSSRTIPERRSARVWSPIEALRLVSLEWLPLCASLHTMHSSRCRAHDGAVAIARCTCDKTVQLRARHKLLCSDAYDSGMIVCAMHTPNRARKLFGIVHCVLAGSHQQSVRSTHTMCYGLSICIY